jgi:triosephosphate isomerase
VEWARSAAVLALRHDALRHRLASIAVLPGFLSIAALRAVLEGTDVAIGAQDLHYEDRGAFTGAVSGADLFQLGCRYAEIGHAERRSLFGDDDRIVRLKVAAALRNTLTPILCIGEPTRMPVASAQGWCLQQLEAALGFLVDEQKSVPLVVAYEPVWAIGQVATADVEHVRAITRAIRNWLEQRRSLSGSLVIYGGSAGPGTLTELGNAVDGLFLGRFVHNVGALASILDEVLTLFLARATSGSPSSERFH